MDPTIPTNFAQNFLVLLFAVILPGVVLIVGIIIYYSWQELKERIAKLEKEKEENSMLERKFDHLMGIVQNLNRDSRDIDKRFQYICSVTDRLARSESELTQRINSVFETQMDTSLVALLSDGIVKELTKEDKPNPPTT